MSTTSAVLLPCSLWLFLRFLAFVTACVLVLSASPSIPTRKTIFWTIPQNSTTGPGWYELLWTSLHCCFRLPFNLEIFSSETGLWSTHLVYIKCYTRDKLVQSPNETSGIWRWANDAVFQIIYRQLWSFLAIRTQLSPVTYSIYPQKFCQSSFVSTNTVVTSQGQLLLLRTSTISRSHRDPPEMIIGELNNDNSHQANGG